MQKHQSAQKNHTSSPPPARGGVLHEVTQLLNLRVGGVETTGQQKRERERKTDREKESDICGGLH